MLRYFIILAVAGVCVGSNFLTNGDFEQPLTTGWTEYSPDAYGSISRSTTYDPDPDYEAYVFRQGSGGLGTGYDMLYQTIDLLTTDLYFSVNLKLYAWDNGNSWAGSACVLYYRNDNDEVLGVTRICRYSAGCPWTNSSTAHNIVVYDSLWHSYNFNIDTELQNLSAVDPEDVAKVTVALLDTAYNC